MKPTRGRPDGRRLERRVEDALAATPRLDDRDVCVRAAAGVVTLSGCVPRLADRALASRIAAGVEGARGVANDLGVRFLAPPTPGGAEAVLQAVAALGWNLLVPKRSVIVIVESGWLTLEGRVDWQYQKHIAGREVRSVPGIRGVTNNIAVRPPPGWNPS